MPKPKIVSFQNQHPRLLEVPKGQRSRVINAALECFFAADGELVAVWMRQPPVTVQHLPREEAIKQLKAELGLES